MQDIIASISPWHYLIGALLLFVLSATVGDFDLLPWAAASLLLLALLDFLEAAPIIQLAAFPISFIVFLAISKRVLSNDAGEQLIGMDINQMIDHSVRITKIDPQDNSLGEGAVAGGRAWRVRHINGDSLAEGDSYFCKEVDGACLLVK